MKPTAAYHPTLRVVTFACQKKNAKYLIKTFAYGGFLNIFRGKNFREFKIREMHAAPKKKKQV